MNPDNKAKIHYKTEHVGGGSGEEKMETTVLEQQ